MEPYENLRPTQKRFLLCFEACASITQACRWAKVHRCNHYDWMESEAYRAAFELAEVRANRTLEDEAVRRAHQGVKKAIRYKGKVVGTDTEYSDTLMTFLLKGGNRKKFGDRWQGQLTGANGAPLFPLAALDSILDDNSSTDTDPSRAG